MIPVPVCLTCLDRNFETGFFTTLGLFLAPSFRYILLDNLPSQPTQKKGISCGCNPEILGVRDEQLVMFQ
jgi:hypothetical protein